MQTKTPRVVKSGFKGLDCYLLYKQIRFYKHPFNQFIYCRSHKHLKQNVLELSITSDAYRQKMTQASLPFYNIGRLGTKPARFN